MLVTNLLKIYYNNNFDFSMFNFVFIIFVNFISTKSILKIFNY